MTVRVSADKDVRYAARILRRFGFEFIGFSNSHPIFEHAAYGTIGLPDTPGDRNWLHAHRRDLARRMGITVAELEARIIGQARIGKRSASSKRPGRARSRPPRAMRHLVAVPAPQIVAAPEPEPEPAPAWTAFDPITDERREWWRRKAAELERLNAEARHRGLSTRKAA